MQLRYFAWVRQRIGISSEEVTPPDTVRTIADMIGWLKTRGPEFEAAFENEAVNAPVQLGIGRFEGQPLALLHLRFERDFAKILVARPSGEVKIFQVQLA